MPKMNLIIKILNSENPGKFGTQFHAGFDELVKHDGKMYGDFRKTMKKILKETGKKPFSPSTVINKALNMNLVKLCPNYISIDPNFALSEHELREAEGNSTPEITSEPMQSDAFEQPPKPIETQPRGKNSAKKVRCEIKGGFVDLVFSEDEQPFENRTTAPEEIETPKLNEPLQDVAVFVSKGVDPNKPGIYIFFIEGGEVYVGKYEDPYRFKTTYPERVRRLIANEPYKESKPDGFRRIHRALAKAVEKGGKKISLMLIENWDDGPSRSRRERELINMIGTLNV